MSLKIILSPAKKLNFEAETPELNYSEPALWTKTVSLSKTLKKLSVKKIRELMSLSPDLGTLNYDRYQQFETLQTEAISKPAGFVFNGEVYTGLSAASLNSSELNFLNNNTWILSGLYGAVKPLQYIQPYRLEMGTKLPIGKKKNLYEFWGNTITDLIQSELAEEDVIVNLASIEYFKAVKIKSIKNRVITPVFKDYKNGDYKTIMVFAKKSRGAMANYIAKNKLSDVEQLKAFDVNGYEYNVNLSTEKNWVFTR